MVKKIKGKKAIKKPFKKKYEASAKDRRKAVSKLMSFAR